MTTGPRLTLPGAVGLLMAAGAGRRAGGPKALRRDADGTSWLTRATTLLLDGGCSSVLVVLGAGAVDARRLVPGDPRVRIVEASDWALGLGASLRAGLVAAEGCDPVAVLVHLVDLPDVSADVVRRVLGAGVFPTVLARAVYGGRAGHPVLVGADHLAALGDQLAGDRGAKDFLAAHDVCAVPCGDLATGLDVDGPPVTLTTD